MKNIEDFLLKFKLIEDPKKDKERVQEVLRSVLGIEVEKEGIKIKNSTISITVEPVIKSYIFTKKEAVLLDLQSKLSKNSIKIFFK